jgi:hypothetical protein
MTDVWKKITSEKVADIIDIEELEDESQALLKPDMRPETFIGLLSTAGLLTDAVTVMASSLPKREAVWWACLCAGDMETMSRNKWEALALKAAEAWAFKPTEENRQNAFQQAQKSDNPSAGTLACMAVVFSEAVLELPDDQKVEFDINKFAGIASAVVLISASEKKGDHNAKALEQYLLKGKNIACGGSGKA